MKFFPATESISAKLIRMNLLVSGTALLLACVAFFSYDLISFQHNLIRNLTAEARIVGSNSVSALLFNDRDAAVNTLTALGGSQDILGAAIMTDDGKIFAQYRGDNDLAMHFPPLPSGVKQRNWVSGRDVLLAQRIIFQGRSEGTVYIFARLGELVLRVRQYLLIAAGIPPCPFEGRWRSPSSIWRKCRAQFLAIATIRCGRHRVGMATKCLS
jgi:hypothetical protein